MEILIASLRGPTNLDKRGGAQDYIRYIFGRFNHKICNITVICSAENFNNEMLPMNEIVNGIKVIRCGSPSNRYFPIVRELNKRIKSADILIENMMGYPLLLPVILNLKKTKLPFLAIKHHYEGKNYFRTQGMFKGFFGIILEECIQPLVYRNIIWVGVSDQTINRISSAWVSPVNKVVKIPPGINSISQESNINKSSSPLILYFGAIDLGRKRLDHLIEAYEIVQDKIKDTQLVIGGDGPNLNELKKNVDNLNVVFTGFMSEEEKIHYLSKAWIFASPSNSEGFGITWIEANAFGLPVVGYELGLDTVDKNCSIMVEMNNIELLADAIVNLICDETKRKKMSLYAKDNARRFDWDASSNKFYDFIQSILSKKFKS